MLDFIGWCLFFVFGFLVGFVWGEDQGKGELIQKSITSGVAYYDCAPDTGKCEFKFKGE